MEMGDGAVFRFKVIEKAEVDHWKPVKILYRIKMIGMNCAGFGCLDPEGTVDLMVVPPDTANLFEVGKTYVGVFVREAEKSKGLEEGREDADYYET